MCVLSSSVLLGEPHHRACRLLVLACHRGATHTPWWCRSPPGPPSHGQPIDNHLKSACIQSIRRRHIKLVRTRPPASLQIRAIMFLSAYPRRPSIPACAQAARWWPQGSSGWQHRQLRAESGRTWRRRRKHHHSEQVGRDGRFSVGRCHGERRASSRACLGPDQRLRMSWGAGEQPLSELTFNSHACFVLPSSVSGSWFSVFGLPLGWQSTQNQICP